MSKKQLMNYGSVLEEAKKHYDWFDATMDDDFVATFRSRLIKYGRYSVYESETLFRLEFNASKMKKDGQYIWPLGGDFECCEKDKDVVKIANKLFPSREADAKCAFYRGNYKGFSGRQKYDGRPIEQVEFVIDDENPKHILFVSNKGLRSGGNLYNCDVLIGKGFNAIPMSIDTARYLLERA